MLKDTINHRIGNYIVQAMIRTSCKINVADMLSYIFDFVINNTRLLSCDRFGCRVVQYCIASNINPKTKLSLFVSIFNSLTYLGNDEYGNYCVQKCMECADYSIKKLFVEEIFFGINLQVENFANSKLYNARYTLPNSLRESFENYIINVQNPNTIINFSKFGFGKYSSIVCDAAFKYATQRQQERLIRYISNPNIAIKYNVLFGMVHHEYGNFVVKNMIKTLINSYAIASSDNNGSDLAHYSYSLNKMNGVLNIMFAFTNRYHSGDKFLFSHNVMCTIQQWNHMHLNKSN